MKVKKADKQIKNKNISPCLSYYLKEAAKYPIVKHADTIELFKQWKEQDNRKAYDKIIASNLRLVISIAMKTSRKEMLLEDLIQEGNMGLIRAATKFDYSKGFRFTTYATWWIKQAIGQYMLKQGRTVRIPAHAANIQRKLLTAENSKENIDINNMTDDELTEMFGAGQSVIKAASAGRKSIVSLDEQIKTKDAKTKTRGELIPDTNFYNNPFEVLSEKENIAIIQEVAKSMPKKEAAILKLRFGINEPMDAINDYILSNEKIEELKNKNK